ncbi:bifunctional diguanylate cyclase/phosphodiesterase [uncultured Sphingomonas sp.]|uniref:putative bifunctional diguanylate cyclase/phosphodiesterase n=1 Tax=uncultured Sphingomonas sp. TaxID=158754 RepID=UPI002605D799|nr:bifunctional diguanylate cyclase/phosphodiesterase [uncultured Sphingomonas sp.]
MIPTTYDAPAGSAPLCLLSFRQRDELAHMAERAGWAAIAARRSDGLERRFLASGAAVVVIDARDTLAEGLAAARVLSDAVQTNGAALLLLIGRREASAVGAAYEAGATHYLAAPFAEGEFAQALRFAARHAERLAGGHRAAAGRAKLVASESMTWRWSPAHPSTLTISAALAQAGGLSDASAEVTRSQAQRLLGRGGMRAALQAVGRLRDEGGIAPFAHNALDGRRIAHHLMLEDGIVVGHVEPLDGKRPGSDASPRDSLTGLDDGHGARRWIEARLAAGQGPILVVIGLSRFDMVNAAFGRSVGDAIIRSVARRIERLASAGNGRRRLIARLAGAEFAIGLPDPATLDEAELLSGELLEAIGRPFVAGEHVVTLNARVGIATTEPGGGDAGDLLRHASLALADARDGETARVRVFTEGEQSRQAEERRLELDLRLALDEDRIEILWQPQVSVPTGRIVGVEALARWRHPLLGELGAEALFAAAERSDYLIELSNHVQRKAIGIAAAWTGVLATLRVAVNVTAADIAEPGFSARILALASESGLRDRLTIEVTESGLMEDLAAAADLLAGLRSGGLRVAIDDFGTGYSSLAYLKALPLDTIKIDRRLAQDIAGSPRDRIVVRSVIDMGRSLGLSVVAEGVETEEQLTLLARAGCNIYQGFLCAPPVDVRTLEGLVRAAA